MFTFPPDVPDVCAEAERESSAKETIRRSRIEILFIKIMQLAGSCKEIQEKKWKTAHFIFEATDLVPP